MINYYDVFSVWVLCDLDFLLYILGFTLLYQKKIIVYIFIYHSWIHIFIYVYIYIFYNNFFLIYTMYSFWLHLQWILIEKSLCTRVLNRFRDRDRMPFIIAQYIQIQSSYTLCVLVSAFKIRWMVFYKKKQHTYNIQHTKIHTRNVHVCLICKWLVVWFLQWSERGTSWTRIGRLGISRPWTSISMGIWEDEMIRVMTTG